MEPSNPISGGQSTVLKGVRVDESIICGDALMHIGLMSAERDFVACIQSQLDAWRMI